jgi:hypothetical protein
VTPLAVGISTATDLASGFAAMAGVRVPLYLCPASLPPSLGDAPPTPWSPRSYVGVTGSNENTDLPIRPGRTSCSPTLPRGS